MRYPIRNALRQTAVYFSTRVRTQKIKRILTALSFESANLLFSCAKLQQLAATPANSRWQKLYDVRQLTSSAIVKMKRAQIGLHRLRTFFGAKYVTVEKLQPAFAPRIALPL